MAVRPVAQVPRGPLQAGGQAVALLQPCKSTAHQTHAEIRRAASSAGPRLARYLFNFLCLPR